MGTKFYGYDIERWLEERASGTREAEGYDGLVDALDAAWRVVASVHLLVEVLIQITNKAGE